MHIVFMTNSFPIRGNMIVGTGSYVANMARILAANGHKITVVTESASRKITKWNGITIWKAQVSIPENSGKQKRACRRAIENVYRSICYNREIEKINAKEPIDIVHSLSAFGIALVRRKDIPYVVTVTEYPSLWRGANEEVFDFEACMKSRKADEELFFAALKRADMLICPSRLLCNLVRKKTRIVPKHVESPPVLLEADHYDLSEPGLQEGQYWVTYGSQMMRKEIHILAQVIDQLLEKYPHMKYVMIGRNREIPFHGESITASKLYAKLIKKHKDRFLFMGEIADRKRLFSIIQNAYACILPTRMDNLPNTCLEAMTLKKLVISTTSQNGTSIEELIKDNYNGFLAQVDNKEDLLYKIEQAMQLSETEKGSFEERAFLRVSELTPENVYRIMMKLYQKMILNFQKR